MARDPFPVTINPSELKFFGQFVLLWLKFSRCASLCRYNFCTWQVWHETHICCQGMRKICSDDQKVKYDKMKFQSRWKCALQWCHNERDGVKNHRRLDCLLKRLFSRRSKKASKLHVTGLCLGNALMTGGFPTQRASNAEDVLIWWPHHGMKIIWWNGPQDIKATKSEESRPTVPWKGRNESPLIDIHSSIKAIHQSVIDIMDIHNSNMDVYK